jgi:site-specific recombinase XerD
MSEAPEPDTTPPDWDHIELFDQWAASRTRSGPKQRERLSPEVAALYRTVWDKWVRWLTTRRTAPAGEAARPRHSYRNATSDDVDAFLAHGIEPAATREGAEVSPITVARYGGLLQMVYDFAMNNHLVASNPARARTGGTVRGLRLVGKDPAGEGQVLTVNHWNAVCAAVPAADDPDPMHLRDRAVMLVLMDAHLTSSELCALDLDCLEYAIEDKPHRRRFIMKVEGKRKAQKRKLHLDTLTSQALDRWIAARAMIGVPERQHALFVTDREKRNRISKRVLFHIVATVMHRTGAAGHALPNHIGPQVLRNTRIVLRLNRGDDPDLVVKEAGMKNQHSFRGLRRHL